MTIDELAKELYCVLQGTKGYPYKVVGPSFIQLATHVNKLLIEARIEETRLYIGTKCTKKSRQRINELQKEKL